MMTRRVEGVKAKGWISAFVTISDFITTDTSTPLHSINRQVLRQCLLLFWLCLQQQTEGKDEVNGVNSLAMLPMNTTSAMPQPKAKAYSLTRFLPVKNSSISASVDFFGLDFFVLDIA